MLRGLQGRRVAVCATRGADAVRDALEASGAKVLLLGGSTTRTDEEWHSGNYAALIVGECDADSRSRVVQLVREFLVAQKPVGLLDGGQAVLAEAGGQREDVAFSGSGDDGGFANDVAGRLANLLDESQVDEMSDMSFPASDPPAISPSTIGARTDDRGDVRP